MNASEGEQSDWLDLRAMERRYGISRSTLYHWIEDGILTQKNGLRQFGGLFRINQRAFERNPPKTKKKGS